MPATPPAAPTRKRLKELQAAGHSLRKTAELLQDEGFPPPPGWKKWHHSAVKATLEREAKRAAAQPAAPPALTLEVTGPYTPADRRLWHFLLHQVWAELGEQADHRLPLTRVMPALPDEPDPDKLWEAVKRLTASRITWTAELGQRRLAVAVPLLSAALSANALAFHFSPYLVKLLLDDTQYARLQALLEGKQDEPAP